MVEPKHLYLSGEPYLGMETYECRICHKIKPIIEFQKRKDSKLGIRRECKACISEYKHKYHLLHIDERHIYNKKYRINNKEYFREYDKKYYIANRDKLILANKIRSKAHEQKIKYIVLSHYSISDVPQCSNPYNQHKEPYTDIRALSIDHINGGGGKHRRLLFGENKKGGRSFYRWLQDNKYPDGYQVLCMNCQWIKRNENKELNKK